MLAAGVLPSGRDNLQVALPLRCMLVSPRQHSTAADVGPSCKAHVSAEQQGVTVRPPLPLTRT